MIQTIGHLIERARRYVGHVRHAGRAGLDAVQVDVDAYCHRCRLRHPIRCGADRWAAEAIDWERKHPVAAGCRVQYVNRRRRVPANFDDRRYAERVPWFLQYGENTNFSFTYRASAAITNAVATLGTSSTFVAGYASAIVDNSTNKDLDILLSYKVTVGTTPTTNTVIEVDSVSMMDDASWPDVFTGTTGAFTVTSVGVKGGLVMPLEMLNVDSTTTARSYYMSKRSIAALYGGICPDKSLVFTTHNTGVALNATAGNHVLTQQSVYIVGA